MSKRVNLISSAVLILLLVIEVVTFKPVIVKGPGMEPAYTNGTNYLVNKLAYLFSKPERGDVISYHYTQNPQYLGVGRIIGLPGDKLKIQGGKVFVNGTLLEESYVPVNATTQVASKSEIRDTSEGAGEIVDMSGPKIIDEGQELVIPENNFFMMGDNREQSIDSRSLGMLKSKDIIGKLTFKYKLPF
ncbi:MAG: Signal peptidase I [Candidatus Gottesmanbacteria bacterium GW2011_GWC2_39_8]|uniref:Signal peptidase I n=1 Tax=Candidatus Gottesmanbacteria bacterium GW2011_GWC2_39_8 TaxID=1618450 RepID=A0A0G0S5Y0_9BACT|nr:MAG: Signal peptidase I [Candidatus Gottesmanbacteria bacterium GW2011_GWC2_39_8]